MSKLKLAVKDAQEFCYSLAKDGILDCYNHFHILRKILTFPILAVMLSFIYGIFFPLMMIVSLTYRG
jgi:hypothetical protein